MKVSSLATKLEMLVNNICVDRRELTGLDIALIRFVLNGLKDRVPTVSTEGFVFREIIPVKKKYQQGTAEDPIFHYYLVTLKNITNPYMTTNVVCRIRVLTESNDVLPYVNGYFCPTITEPQILTMNLSKAEFFQVL